MKATAGPVRHVDGVRAVDAVYPGGRDSQQIAAGRDLPDLPEYQLPRKANWVAVRLQPRR